jgi:high-affinity nickel permease
MENQETTNSFSSGMNLDETIKQSLRNTASTAGVAAILSICGTGLSLIVFIIQIVRPKPVEFEGFERYGRTTDTSGPQIFLQVIFVFIYVLLFYFLNRFSKFTKAGVNGNMSSQVNDGLGNLSSYFKTIGITLIILLSLCFLGIVFTGLGSRTTSSY